MVGWWHPGAPSWPTSSRRAATNAGAAARSLEQPAPLRRRPPFTMTTTIGTSSGGTAARASLPAPGPLDPVEVRRDFPILDREFNGRQLVYLDSANTSQKPRQVLDALTEESTRLFEESRDKVARFAGADRRATVFTKNVTEAINLVAYAWGLRNLREG